MGSKLSVEEVLANLEARVALLREKEAHHRDREAFHVQRQDHHREQRALHAAELEKALQDLEVFRTVATSAAARTSVEPKTMELPPPGRKQIGRMIMRVAESPDLQEPFGPTDVAEETRRRFAAQLSRPVSSRTASDVLRRMLAEGRLELFRKGTAKREALYKRPAAGT